MALMPNVKVSAAAADAAAAAAAVVVVVGSLNLDLVGRAPRIPAPGETVLGDSLQRFHGGKGGNQAVAAARLGARVRFIGAVGEDAAGAELVAGLTAEGIDSAGVQRVAGASGCALITVAASGENAITVLPGANLRVAAPEPEPAAAAPMAAALAAPIAASIAALRGAALLVLQLEIPLAVNQAWARAARALGVPVLLNAAPMEAAARELLADVSLLVVNEGELAALVGAQGAEGALEDQLQRAAQCGPAEVVVTLGAQGSAALSQGHISRAPGRAVQVVDTTGAGDTFVGALATALAAGQSLQQALPWANAAAALSCMQAGARGGMPGAAAVRALLAA
jgi:ribokinase